MFLLWFRRERTEDKHIVLSDLGFLYLECYSMDEMRIFLGCESDVYLVGEQMVHDLRVVITDSSW